MEWNGSAQNAIEGPRNITKGEDWSTVCPVGRQDRQAVWNAVWGVFDDLGVDSFMDTNA